MFLTRYISFQYQIDEDLTARVNMADAKFSFQEIGRIYEPAWMSPEALSKRPADINHEASDMWSFAVLLWELATREVPFADLSPMECGMKVSNAFLTFKIRNYDTRFSLSSPCNFSKKYLVVLYIAIFI